MDRRQFLGTSALAAMFAGTAGCAPDYTQGMPAKAKPQMGPDGKRLLPWYNWSGYLSSVPSGRPAPKTEEELAALLKSSKGPIRPVGAGHSFTPLVPTDGQILSLRHFQGMRSHDPDKLTATFGAGTKLGDVGEPLHKVGQALQNMPDIDEQTLAGAISTGTHGTGELSGALHSFLTSMRLVTPEGEILELSADKDADLFNAAKVSLGALGVITEVTLQNVPTLRMKRKFWLEPFDQLIERYDELVAQNFSVDAYYIPFSSVAAVTTINPTDEPIKPRMADGDNDAVMELKDARDKLGWWSGLRRWLIDQATAGVEIEENIDDWYKVFPSERAVRFNEMEYHMDRSVFLDTLKKVRDKIEKDHHEVFFPVEMRVVKGDDAWLSPFYGHESASIAVHRYYEENPLPVFQGIEPLYQPIKGRPHWGKMHSLTATDLAQRYPKWSDFNRIRKQLDPSGKMLNDHLKQVFGHG